MRDSGPGQARAGLEPVALAHNTPQIHRTVGNFVIAIYFLSNQFSFKLRQGRRVFIMFLLPLLNWNKL